MIKIMIYISKNILFFTFFEYLINSLPIYIIFSFILSPFFINKFNFSFGWKLAFEVQNTLSVTSTDLY